MLFDLDRVIVDYPSVPSAERYDVLVTYLNEDDTSAIGGNVQSLKAGASDEFVVHGDRNIPTSTPTQSRFLLPPAAHATDALRLNFIRENGFRAVVSQAWLVERALTGDVTAPSSMIDFPVAGAQLADTPVTITGSSSDAGTGVLSVEVGIDDGSGVVFRPVTELRPDGTWSYRWNLPGVDGDQTLSVRATDQAGNVEVPGAGVGFGSPLHTGP